MSVDTAAIREQLRRSVLVWVDDASNPLDGEALINSLCDELDALTARVETAERAAVEARVRPAVTFPSTAIIDTALVIHKSELESLKRHSARRKETIVHIASLALREWIKREDALPKEQANRDENEA